MGYTTTVMVVTVGVIYISSGGDRNSTLENYPNVPIIKNLILVIK